VRPAGVLVAIVLAFAVETTLTRFARPLAAIDLLLVVVVYVALRSGPVTGLLAGAVAGLARDYGLSNSIIGIGGLATTIVGFFAGVIGTQFIVTQPLPRFVVFFGATVVYQTVEIGLSVLLGLRSFGTPYAGVAIEAAINAVAGVMLFELAELVPDALERRRMRR
jgi:rod shape-determining protein MreD